MKNNDINNSNVKVKSRQIAAALLITCASLCCSCSDWLNITPEDTVSADELFSTYSGYHTALNGIYQELASNKLYGREFTWGFASALSQCYSNNNEPNVEKRYTYTERYEYNTNEVEGYTADIWLTGYNVIANINNLLQHLEKADKNLFPGVLEYEVELIRGEALALRAMMHFDLLRLFAPAPIEGNNTAGIPYNDQFPNKFAERLPVKDALQKIIADLEEACDQLKRYEGESTAREKYLTNWTLRYSQGIDGIMPFFLGRGTRLNYVAAQTLLARVYLYAGNQSAAQEVAQTVRTRYVAPLNNIAASENFCYLVATNPAWNSSDIRSYPHKLMQETLFGLYNVKLASNYEDLVSSSRNAFALKNVEQVYGNDISDVRYGKLIYEENPGAKGEDLIHRSLKYNVTNNASALENSMIPVIRISELQFITLECLSATDLPKAVDELNKFRKSVRGCTVDIVADTREDFLIALSKEIKREYACEGAHYFFFCKQHRLPVNDGLTDINLSSKYTLPIPQNEISL
ncbi:hypothetical protein AGMMS50239_22470 [Bacteroidia bacterium]|nr:hypothetical protein AGMMS50239_22470 [Bacteroidia bacterium]